MMEKFKKFIDNIDNILVKLNQSFEPFRIVFIKFKNIFAIYWKKFMHYVKMLLHSFGMFYTIAYLNTLAWGKWQIACAFGIFFTVCAFLVIVWWILRHFYLTLRARRFTGDWSDCSELNSIEGHVLYVKTMLDNDLVSYYKELENLVKLRKNLSTMINSLPDEGIACNLYPITFYQELFEGYPKSNRFCLIEMYNQFTEKQKYILTETAKLTRTARTVWWHSLIVIPTTDQEVLDLVEKEIQAQIAQEAREELIKKRREDEKRGIYVYTGDETGCEWQTFEKKRKGLIFLIFSTEFFNKFDFNLFFIFLLNFFLITLFFYFWKDGRFSISTILNKWLPLNPKSIWTSHVLKNSFMCISLGFLNINNNSINDVWYFSGQKLIHYVSFIEHFEFLDIILVFNIFILVLFGTNILFAKNAMFSLLSLIYIFVNSGFLLIFFNLEFFGLLYVIIYVGAIAVLFLFIIMMLKFEKNVENTFVSIKRRFLNLIFNLILFILILFFFFSFYKNNFLDKLIFINTKIFPEFFNVSYLNIIKENEFVISRFFNIQRFVDDLNHLSFSLYLDYVYIFLLAGLILLLSMIAPIVLTYRQRFDIKLQKSSLQILKNKKNILFLKDLK